MVKLRDHIVGLAFFISSFLLEDLQVLLIPLLFLSDLRLIVLDRGIISLLRPFSLLLEPSFQAIALDLKEALELQQLFLRLLLHIPQCLLKVTSLLVQLPFQLQVSLFGSIFGFVDHASLLGLEGLDLVEGTCLNVLGGGELLA
jgi:hypothetical protein